MNAQHTNALPDNDNLLEYAIYKAKHASAKAREVARDLWLVEGMASAYDVYEVDAARLERAFSSTSPIAYEDRQEEADGLSLADFGQTLQAIRDGLLDARSDLDDAIRLVRETEHRAHYLESVLRVEGTPEEWREHAEHASRLAEEASDDERQRWLDIAGWAEQQAVSQPDMDRVADDPGQAGSEQD